MDRWICLIDMDAFFASVEQYRNHPELIGKPVCVGHDPRGGHGRGVVRSASYEARAAGVKSGMPVSRAYWLCTDAVFIDGDFASYLEASEEVMSVLAEFADGGRLRRASIDEAYIEITSGVAAYESPRAMARAIQEAVKAKTQLPCSIGVASSMSVAKVACKMHKPMGITVAPQEPDEVRRFLAPLPVSAINGVGEKTTMHLNSHGIETLGQIQAMTLPELWPIMGKSSVWLHQRASGIDDRPVIDSGPHVRMSIGKDRTFMEDVDPKETEVLRDSVSMVCTRIADKIASKSLLYKTVTVKMRYADYDTLQRSRSLPVATDDRQTLTALALELFERNRDPHRAMRLIGVRVSGLEERGPQMLLTEFV
ncbi:MAG: DNA polymerase IV [Candidatus Thorarchaeota archaeon]|nr:DNA polymerase IV [Candidatus Thorarchaeota archaeon]